MQLPVLLWGGFSAADRDRGETFDYSIISGSGSGKFVINGDNLEVAGELDREEKASYALEVAVTDSSGLSFSRVFTITVADVNEHAPEITADSEVAVHENTTGVLEVTAVDPDVTSAISYAVCGGADAALFTMDPATGWLAFKTEPDYENPADAGGDGVYEVEVRACDGEFSDTREIAVTVLDINDTPVAVNKNVQTTAGAAYTFRAPDFGFADQDAGDKLQQVKLETLSLPPGTELTLGGNDVTAGDVISAGNIDAGALQFAAGENCGGDEAGFTFRVSDGQAYSTATYQMSLDINPAPVTLAEINFDASSYTLEEGESRSTVVTATYSNGENTDVTGPATYTSSDSRVVEISANGVVAAKGPGSAEITAEYNGQQATAEVTVVPAPPVLTGITLDAGSYTLEEGERTGIDVTAEYSDGSTSRVTGGAIYMSSGPGIVSISPEGVITGESEGSAVITVVYGDCSARAGVTVTRADNANGNNSGHHGRDRVKGKKQGPAEEPWRPVYINWDPAAHQVAIRNEEGSIISITGGPGTPFIILYFSTYFI